MGIRAENAINESKVITSEYVVDTCIRLIDHFDVENTPPPELIKLIKTVRLTLAEAVTV